MPNYTNGFKGAVGGGLSGAGMGMAIGGPMGGLIGGGLGLLGGGLSGLFGGGESDNDAKMRQMLMDYYNNVQGRQAPQAGPAAQAGYSDFRSNQSDLINRLDAMSKGQGPSLAMQQFQQATDRNMASQQALAAGGRGGPLASFNAANNMGMLGANAAQGSAQARIAEEQMALGMLGQNISAGRGADENTNQFNAGQQNDMQRANLEAKLRAMGMNDQAIQATLAQLGGQNARQAQTPSFADQLMGGGAGLFAFGAGQMGNKQAPQMPSGGGLGAAAGSVGPSGLGNYAGNLGRGVTG